MQVRRRLRSGVRRAANQVRGVLATRSWIITIGDVEPTRGRMRVAGSPMFGWWTIRSPWPLPSGATLPAPSRTLVVQLHAATWESLLDLAADPIAVRGTREVHIHVDRWRAPIAGWSGQLGPLPGVLRTSVELPRVEPGPVAISISLVRQRTIREHVAAALAVLSPGAPIPASVSPALAVSAGSPPWLWPGADVGAKLRHLGTDRPRETAEARNARLQAEGRPAVRLMDADVELVRAGAEATGFGDVPPPVVQLGAAGSVGDGPGGILLDARAVPVVRWLPPTDPGANGRLLVRDDGQGPSWALGPDDGAPGPLPAAGTAAVMPGSPQLRWRPIESGPESITLSQVPRWWTVRANGLDVLPPPAAARLLAGIAATGLIVQTEGLPAAVTDLLAEELRDIVRAPLPGPDSETIEWEMRSIRQRRAALRGHAAALRLPGVLRPDAPVIALPPSVSALLVTRRPGLALGALRMMAAQTYPALEVLVGLHGVARTPELERAVAGMPGRARILDLPATANLGEVLGIATSHAEGSFVTKVDDDDLYGPEHIWDLVLARATSGASVVGKAAEFVTFDERGVTVRRHRMQSNVYDRVVAGGTIMVPRGELEALGGWRPVPSGVDRAFLDRVIQAGALIYRTWPFGFIYRRHGEGHTWGPTDAWFLRDIGQSWDGLPPYPEFDQQSLAAVG